MIEEGDYPIIEQMIATALENHRVDADGMVRRGTVTTFDANSRVAQVLVDGDVQAVPIESVLPIDLVPGQRVQVTFHAPHGASITGLAEGIGVAPIYGAILFSFVPFTLTNGGLDPLGGLAVFYDSDGLWDGSSDFVVPAGEQGVYAFTVTADQPGFISPDIRFFSGFTSGSTIWRDPGGGTNESVTSCCVVSALGAGATVTPEIFYDWSGGGDIDWNIQVQFLRLFRTP